MIAAVEAGADPDAAHPALDEMAAELEAALTAGLPPLPAAGLGLLGPAAPRLLAGALVLAHLLDRMLAGRPARSSDAPAWFEAAAALARRQLEVGLWGRG